jgi:hypothetical protein
MKVLSIVIARTGSDLNEPVPLTVAHELSSFGFFQRQVGRASEREAPLFIARHIVYEIYSYGCSHTHSQLAYLFIYSFSL